VTRRESLKSEPAESLWRDYRAHGDADVRLELIERYIGLVHHHALEVVRRTRELELDELVSAGTVGMIQALEAFDPTRGLAFSTYAMPRIRGAMLDELRRRDWTPRTVRARTRALEKARGALRHRLGREPDEGELATELQLDLETCRRWSAETRERTWVPLDASGDEGGAAAPLHEAIADPQAVSPDARVIEDQTLAALRDAFDGLTERDRLIVSLSFYEEMSLREIGELLHITESRVSQVRTRALQRLREAMHAREAA